MNPDSNIIELKNQISTLQAKFLKQGEELKRKEEVISEMHQEKIGLNKKAKKKRRRKKKEVVKIDEVNQKKEGEKQNNQSEIEIKDLRKQVEALQKEVLRKEEKIINLHREKNLIKKKLKVEEKRKKKTGLIVKELKRQNKNLKNERKELKSEKNKIKTENIELEFSNENLNDRNEILEESIKNVKKESHEKDKKIELKDEEHQHEVNLLNEIIHDQKYAITKITNENTNMKQQLKDMYTKVDSVNRKIIKIENAYTELSLNTSKIIQKVKKHRKFKFFCF